MPIVPNMLQYALSLHFCIFYSDLLLVCKKIDMDCVRMAEWALLVFGMEAALRLSPSPYVPPKSIYFPVKYHPKFAES